MPWEDYIPDFVAMWTAKGCPFDGMVGMVDGHFQPCCRPGGLGCINDNLCDYQMFNGNVCLCETLTESLCVTVLCGPGSNSLVRTLEPGKEREHCLKFQSVVLPNGLCVINGPFLGPEHDATCMLLSALESELHALTLHLNSPLCRLYTI